MEVIISFTFNMLTTINWLFQFLCKRGVNFMQSQPEAFKNYTKNNIKVNECYLYHKLSTRKFNIANKSLCTHTHTHNSC